jgi:trehalose/maltose hydrolase-like predicted phosphorylase
VLLSSISIGGVFVTLWHVSEETFPSTTKQLHSQETAFSVGNGYYATRGTFEEGYPHADPATLLFGVFDTVPIAGEELANAPDWTRLGLLVNGESFRLDRGKILSYQRTLDIETGLLVRTVAWESPGGIRLHITSERFASLADEHIGAIRYSVRSDQPAGSQPLEITLWANFNAAVGNYDVMHWETFDQGEDQGLVWLQSETRHTRVTLVQSMSFTCNRADFQRSVLPAYIAPGVQVSGKLAAGEAVTTEKIVVMFTSRDTEQPLEAALGRHHGLFTSTSQQQATLFAELFAQNSQAWADYWRDADVIIEGDEKAQVGIRYNIFQLRISTSSHDDRYSVAAKGLTGFGYRGHIFHDTEIFMLPFFTYVQPQIARNLLLYRHHLLPKAREKAHANGFEGAQYPWESTLSGAEMTPPSIVHPETGEVIDVLNGFLELHITASIAHATWEYWKVSGDDGFMRDYGAEIVLSTAMFWASRAEYKEQTGNYEIRNVVGPDEWHEHVNNNTYTNYMARWNVRAGLAILDWLRTNAVEKAQELEAQLGITGEHIEHWQEVSQRLIVLQDPQTKIFEQFEGFFGLETLDIERYRGRKESYQGLVGVDEVQKYRIVKQADVLMLLTVMLNDFDVETKQANWDYYYPITDHDYGSSLTPALHVILASELGHLEDAYKLFTKGNLVDLENLRGNTPEGIHDACCGAVWQAVVFGFAGLRVSEDGYTTNPHWPDSWTRLAFTFRYKGERIVVDLSR